MSGILAFAFHFIRIISLENAVLIMEYILTLYFEIIHKLCYAVSIPYITIYHSFIKTKKWIFIQHHWLIHSLFLRFQQLSFSVSYFMTCFVLVLVNSHIYVCVCLMHTSLSISLLPNEAEWVEQLKSHISSHKREVERTVGAAGGVWKNPHPVIHALQQGHTPTGFQTVPQRTTYSNVSLGKLFSL